MSWFDDLRTTALVGTGRHPVPPLPDGLAAQPPPGLTSEELLLGQAALADAITRASRKAEARGAPRHEPAPADPQPEANAEAARLLDLLLNQSPVGQELRWQLVVDWLQLAADARRRVPHRLLPALFGLAAARTAVADHLEPAIGARGRWLQSLDPGTRAAAGRMSRRDAVGQDTEAAPSEVDWAGLGSAEAAVELERLRAKDPVDGRVQLQAQWKTLSARDRAKFLEVLATGLNPDDEPLLEHALDDKAKTVREVGAALLDRLPDSARAGRMARRLEPLLHVRGVLSKRIEIDLPGEPGPDGLRDGLAPHPRSGEPDRLALLDTIIRGAPLTVWSSASGKDPEGTVKLLKGEARILRQVAATAALRGDLPWVRALLTVLTDTSLLNVLPADERSDYLAQHIRSSTELTLTLVPVLADIPRPWPADLAAAVLHRIAEKNGGLLAARLAGVLPTALPPEAADRCRSMLGHSDDDATRRRILRDAIQYQSFLQSLTEAFR
ncbi:DUF5691 domain-containing protein [Paenarthrobacter sp. NPDC089989]|uniref:DUF5691 domain-containing protein n=1 Tax=unclassified Paenarthrobacter TaxID=2634190 RepID=UPI00381C13D0